MLAGERPYRVLVVGNDGATRALVSGYLEGSGIGVECAVSAEDALARVNGHAPDLVVVDTDGETSSGLLLCQMLRADSSTLSLPVIALAKSFERRLEGFAVGVDEFMIRSVKRDEFLVRVKALLRVSAARRELLEARLEAEVMRREEIRETFQRYVSPRLVDQILSDRSLRATALRDKNTRVRAAVLFADMRGFTRISEQLSPTEVVPLLNEYFALLTEIAFKYEGTVFNMAGDCLMVGFGVPFEQPDSSVRAVRTAHEMLTRFRDLASQWIKRHRVETGLGIGINEGEVIAGNIGSPAYMSYTIVGDAVNVASRLGQRARAGEMLFSEAVKLRLDATGADFDAQKLPPLALRGRSSPVNIYCIPVNERLDVRPAAD